MWGDVASTQLTPIREKIQDALDECRMLILGGQVLIAFAAEAVLEPGFQELSRLGRALCVGGMVALVLAVGLFMWPAAYHRIACRGEDREELHRFTTEVATVGLLPFAMGLVSCVFIVGERAAGMRGGFIVGGGIAVAAVAAWYVIPVRNRRGREGSTMSNDESTPVSDKIRQVLTETRMVLPGAQALLGFGTIAALMDRFKELPAELKAVHLGGLTAIAVAVVLLMTPAAYHRIAERGELREGFERVATRLLLAAMGFLALGMAAAIWLVVEAGTGSSTGGRIAAGGVAVGFFAMWFGWPWVCRGRENRGTSWK